MGLRKVMRKNKGSPYLKAGLESPQIERALSSDASRYKPISVDSELRFARPANTLYDGGKCCIFRSNT